MCASSPWWARKAGGRDGRALALRLPDSKEAIVWAHNSHVGDSEATEMSLLPLREPRTPALAAALMKPQLERAIGVIYRPKTERQSHYFQAVLPRQFDEYIRFDETEAVTPLNTEEIEGFAGTYPFGL